MRQAKQVSQAVRLFAIFPTMIVEKNRNCPARRAAFGALLLYRERAFSGGYIRVSGEGIPSVQRKNILSECVGLLREGYSSRAEEERVILPAAAAFCGGSG